MAVDRQVSRLAASRRKGAGAKDASNLGGTVLASLNGISIHFCRCQSFPQVLLGGAPVRLVGLELGDGTVRVQRQRDGAVGNTRRCVVISV